MALTLIKEDGSGRSDANSYATAADADAYYDGHLYASAWTVATTGNKEKALVFATRLIDAQFQFNGWKAHDSQALQWPRERCPDPDKGPSVSFQVLFNLGQYVEPDEIPAAVIKATCEMARELLILDRTAAPPGEGIDVVHTGHSDAAASGAMGASDNTTTKYSKGDTRPIISHVAQAMLSKFGTLIGARSGSVTLKRV